MNGRSGDLEVDVGALEDLQEHAVRRAALVVLPGRVQEARAPAEGGRAPGVGGDEFAQTLELRQCEPVDVCLDRHIAVVGQPRPERVEDAGDGSGCRELGSDDAAPRRRPP